CYPSVLSLLIPPHPTSTLFPYTTLFRSDIVIPETATIGFQFTDINMIDPTTETIEGELEIDPGSFTAVDELVTTYEHTPSVKKRSEERRVGKGCRDRWRRLESWRIRQRR